MRKIKSKETLATYLRVGFIQTRLDGNIAWVKPTPSLQMHPIAELKIWREVKKGFINLKNHQTRPDIIVLPELTIPRGHRNDLRTLSKEIGAVVIAGLDFDRISSNRVQNKALVVVPSQWPGDARSKRATSFSFGKTHPSEEELAHFKEVANFEKLSSINFIPDPRMYVFEAGKFGNIGVAICSDFFDIERFVLYRGQIHHMFVIAHNIDTKSYYFLAEAISRLVYCNVVICNTGQYGDSLAFSPYKEDYKRIIYRHTGQDLFTTQVVYLPVSDLDNAQKVNDNNKIFKCKPPGYKKL
jgi:predicted amidohydrolase